MKNDKDEVAFYSARFSIPKVAKILGVGTDTVRREIRAAKLKAQLRGKRMKCSQAEIDEYIKNQRVDASGEKETYVFKHLEI